MNSLEEALRSKKCVICDLDSVLCHAYHEKYNPVRIEEITRTIRVVIEEHILQGEYDDAMAASYKTGAADLPWPQDYPGKIKVDNLWEWKWLKRHLKNYEPQGEGRFKASDFHHSIVDPTNKNPLTPFIKTSFLSCFAPPPRWWDKFWWVIILASLVGIIVAIYGIYRYLITY